MKTNPMRHALASASVLVVLAALSACASAPPAASATSPGKVTISRAGSPEASSVAATRDARRAALRDLFAVSYRAEGITITSSAPPTVEALPSGLFRVTFPSPSGSASVPATVAQARP